MAEEKASMHCGRIGSPEHNIRKHLEIAPANETPEEKAVRMAKLEACKNNIFAGAGSKAVEIEKYEKVYRSGLNALNERYKAQHHSNKQKSMEQYYEAHKPEEMILQIGDATNSESPELLTSCVKDYMKQLHDWSNAHGDCIGILSYAIHTDETTPHCHLRLIYKAKDKDGNTINNMNKALEQAGIERPDPDRFDGRYNNRQITFSNEQRKLWITVCREHGIEINDIPNQNRRHLSVHDYQMERERETAQAEYDADIEKQVVHHSESIEDLKNLAEYRDLEKKNPDLFNQMREAELDRRIDKIHSRNGLEH